MRRAQRYKENTRFILHVIWYNKLQCGITVIIPRLTYFCANLHFTNWKYFVSFRRILHFFEYLKNLINTKRFTKIIKLSIKNFSTSLWLEIYGATLVFIYCSNCLCHILTAGGTYSSNRSKKVIKLHKYSYITEEFANINNKPHTFPIDIPLCWTKAILFEIPPINLNLAENISADKSLYCRYAS